MYKTPKYAKTSINLENTKEGETIENKVTRLIQNKEPIKDGAPIIWTEKRHGVNPAHNIRTDRWEIATEVMGKLQASKEAKTENIGMTKESKDGEGKTIKGDFGGPESTGGIANTKG